MTVLLHAHDSKLIEKSMGILWCPVALSVVQVFLLAGSESTYLCSQLMSSRPSINIDNNV